MRARDPPEDRVDRHHRAFADEDIESPRRALEAASHYR